MADLKLALIIEALVKGAKDVAGLTGSVKDLGATATKKVPDNTEALREGAKATKLSIQDLTQAIGGLVTVGAITQFARSSVQEFAKAESAFRGLEAVANASGAGIGNALKKAEELAADGLIGVSDASKALQNLLSRGYNLDQAVATITRLKDAAAFNRQASLSMADAVVSATEGLKNENSILVDNAGVTKNVAKMWEEFAKQQGITTAEMTQAQKIQAEYNGIQAETAAQVGNTQKALQGFQGQMAQADQATIKFKQSLGESLAPAVAGLSTVGVAAIEYFFKPLMFLSQTIGVRIGQMAVGLGTLWDAVTNLEFGGVREAIRRQSELAKAEIQAIAKRLSGGSLRVSETLTGAADPAKAKEVADKLAAAAGAATKAQEEMAKKTKSAIEDQIKSYELLVKDTREAWQASLDAEKDYLAKAAALRASAAAQSVDTSTPQGQADANLALLVERQKLERLASTKGTDYKAIEAQANAVRELAKATLEGAEANKVLEEANLAEARGAIDAAAQKKALAEGQKEQWDNAQKILSDLKSALEQVEKGATIRIESAQAKVILDEISAKLDTIKDKTVTLTVLTVGADGQPLGNLTAGAQARAAGGPIFGPGGPRDDRVLALLSNGEHVLTAAEVAAAGGHAGVQRLRQAILSGLLPRFAAGGAVLAAAGGLPALSAGGAAPGRTVNVNFHLGGAAYPLQAAPEVADGLERAIRMAALRRGVA